jgi:hypothetical protein
MAYLRSIVPFVIASVPIYTYIMQYAAGISLRGEQGADLQVREKMLIFRIVMIVLSA